MSDELFYSFELWQGGIVVAVVESADLGEARREIMHYAAVYVQDGPCEIRGEHVAELMPPEA